MGRVSVILSSALFLCAVGLINGQLERCHTTILTPHHFLNMDRFQGKWYPLKVAPSKAYQVYPLNYTCISATISPAQEENVYNFEESYLELENGVVTGPGGASSIIKIGVVDPSRPLPAIWSGYYTPPGSNATIESQAVIVGSNEDEWAIQYSCGVRDGELLERISIWSRQRFLDPIIEKTLDTIVYGIGFRRENFLRISQSQCV